MNIQNTTEKVLEYPLNPRALRKNADFICEEVESNSIVELFKCDECGKAHIRIIREEDSFKPNSIN